jgi:hypothetical protein
MTLIIRQSRIHSFGCYTTRPIRKGTLIIEYVGEYLTYEQADDLYDDFPNTYCSGSTEARRLLMVTASPVLSTIPASRTAKLIRSEGRCGSSRCAILRRAKN